jgi:hypothetical protein
MKNDKLSPWTLRGNEASFDYGGWQGDLALDHPGVGLSIGRESGGAESGFFGVEFDPPHEPILKDCYIRQGDLIIVYPQREQRKFTLQLDYRLLEATRDRILIELWISIQTYLLDSRPGVVVTCRSGDRAVRVRKVGDGPTRVESSRTVSTSRIGDLSWAWLTHPCDQTDTDWNWNDASNAYQARLFEHFMEKGVIRRARMRCLIGATPFAESEVDEAYQAFVESPLPLTA